jgi:hypothetical protein
MHSPESPRLSPDSRSRTRFSSISNSILFACPKLYGGEEGDNLCNLDRGWKTPPSRPAGRTSPHTTSSQPSLHRAAFPPRSDEGPSLPAHMAPPLATPQADDGPGLDCRHDFSAGSSHHPRQNEHSRKPTGAFHEGKRDECHFGDRWCSGPLC